MALALGAVLMGACSSGAEAVSGREVLGSGGQRTGSIGLQLRPVQGLTVSSVHYAVLTGDPQAHPSQFLVAEGNLPSPGTAESFSFGVQLPVGEGYWVSLTAASAEPGDNITCAGAYGPFAVTPNASTLLTVVLTCVDNSSGQLLTEVDVATDACPRLIVERVVAAPAIAFVSEHIQLSAAARDLDDSSAAITFAWTIGNEGLGNVGVLLSPSARDTVLRCEGVGSAEVRVTASNPQCSKSLSVRTSCLKEGCGDGVIDPLTGEHCDPGARPGLPEGDRNCPPTCAKVCGDGFVTLPETCDTLGNLGPGSVPLPAGQTCPNGCSVALIICGDGVAEGSEECDDGTGTSEAPVPAPSSECSPQCERVATAACVECEQAGDCVAFSNNCLGPLALPLSFAQVTVCYDVLQCVQDSGCLNGSGSLASCYCGTLSTTACAAAPFDLSQLWRRRAAGKARTVKMLSP